jgi:hypothetical protein
MITVRLMGGLGNQMFQYAAGRALSLRRGVDLRLDLGWFGNQPARDTPRSYELDAFVGPQATRKQPVALREPHTHAGFALLRLHRLLGREPDVLRQRGTGFDARVLSAPDGSHLVGFWTSERYFADAADAIRDDFTLVASLDAWNAQLAQEIGERTGAVSVHVRRGDYVSNPHAHRFHGLLGLDYYRSAVRILQERVGDVHLYVFSDDPDWCAEHLQLGVPTTVVRGNAGASATEDLVLMSRCAHHVIANSTFSWWGAWLDGRPGSVVVAPQRWAVDPATDFSDVYARGWLQT